MQYTTTLQSPVDCLGFLDGLFVTGRLDVPAGSWTKGSAVSFLAQPGWAKTPVFSLIRLGYFSATTHNHWEVVVRSLDERQQLVHNDEHIVSHITYCMISLIW